MGHVPHPFCRSLSLSWSMSCEDACLLITSSAAYPVDPTEITEIFRRLAHMESYRPRAQALCEPHIAPLHPGYLYDIS